MTLNVARFRPMVRELRRIRQTLERLAQDYEEVHGLKPPSDQELSADDVWYGNEEQEALLEEAIRTGKVAKPEEPD